MPNLRIGRIYTLLTKVYLEAFLPQKKDYKTIVKLNWANGDELKRFHRTANYHRHGLPRDPIEGVAPLPLDDAVELVQRLLAEWAKMLSR